MTFSAYEKTQLLKIIDGMYNEVKQFVQDMIRIPTMTFPGKYEKIIPYLDKKFRDLGLETEIIRVPDLIVKNAGQTTPRLHVLGHLKGSEDKPTLLFLPHVDTVGIGPMWGGNVEDWTLHPFSGEYQNGRIHGRGAMDCKGRLAAYVVSAVALKKCAVQLKGSLTVLAWSDEETWGGSNTGLGLPYLVEKGLVKADVAVSEGYSTEIRTPTAGGAMRIRLTTHGRSVPTIGGKGEGINAIEKMTTAIQKLLEFEEELKQEPSNVKGAGHSTMNIDTIEGGSYSLTPDKCSILVNFRTLPPHTNDEIRSRIMKRMDAATKEDPAFKASFDVIREEYREEIRYPRHLLDLLQQALVEVNGSKLPVTLIPGDMYDHVLLDAGIPNVNYGAGTHDCRAHTTDEFVSVKNILDTAKVLAVFASNYLSPD